MNDSIQQFSYDTIHHSCKEISYSISNIHDMIQKSNIEILEKVENIRNQLNDTNEHLTQKLINNYTETNILLNKITESLIINRDKEISQSKSSETLNLETLLENLDQITIQLTFATRNINNELCKLK